MITKGLPHIGAAAVYIDTHTYDAENIGYHHSSNLKT
ncbi:MAG: hypothetical protein ACFWT6_12425 [Virgibacillus proomii]|jgi:hypothetical protein